MLGDATVRISVWRVEYGKSIGAIKILDSYVAASWLSWLVRTVIG